MAGAVTLGLVAAMSVPVAAWAAPPGARGHQAGAVRAPAAGPATGVIVRYDPATGPAVAERAVVRAGGTVGRRLGLVDGFTARVPKGAVAALRAAAGVEAVTPNGRVRLASDEEWRADEDLNSLYGITRSAGVPDAWAASVTGAGVGVALIDSGVAPVKGLDGAGKVVNGPDLSFESQADNLRYLDTYGHGTHLAGIIAGRDPGVTAGAESDPRYFVGVAPGAHIVNLKVAAVDGATDVSQVIAAIDWAVRHRNDPGLNIRVLNLSFGTDSVQDSRLDPLSHAVEAAWRKGIVVVVAVGNDGAERTTVSMPAANPYVIAVGSADPHETIGRADDTLANFSTVGNAGRHADLLAAGRSIVSLRNPGSYIDVEHPEGMLAGDPARRFFRGSGTSQSTAVVAGAVALLLEQRPGLAPDQIKDMLMSSADEMPAAAGPAFGAGQLNLARALTQPTPSAEQDHPASTGLGTIEGARGSAHVIDPEDGTELTGEQDIFGQAWQPADWAPASTDGNAWVEGSWNGSDWAGSDWSGSSWAGRTWSGRTWSGLNWSGRTWSGRTWSSAVWTGRTWSGRTWSGRTWSGSEWS
jgi:serine protease AprX